MRYLPPRLEKPDPRFEANAGCVLLTHNPDAETLALALHLLRHAAKNRDALAQSVVGWCHLFGHHLPLDPVLGAHFLRLSAEQGYPDGLFWYGLCLCEGRGTHPDPATGKQLIVRAAAEGNYDAQEWLDEQPADAE